MRWLGDLQKNHLVCKIEPKLTKSVTSCKYHTGLLEVTTRYRLVLGKHDKNFAHSGVKVTSQF
jgi:hypothetical protein